MNATQWATFWVFLGLLVFLAILIYMKVPGMAVAALDKRAAKIRTDLEEAERLRREAEGLLKEYQRKRGEAEKEAVRERDASCCHGAVGSAAHQPVGFALKGLVEGARAAGDDGNSEDRFDAAEVERTDSAAEAAQVEAGSLGKVVVEIGG